MDHQKRTAWIKRILMLLLTVIITAGVWFYPKPIEEVKAPPKAVEAPPKPIISPENGLALVHYHLPLEPDSEKLAGILDKVQTKYGKVVNVIRNDFSSFAENSETQGVTMGPHVTIISGTEKVFEFQGVWTQHQVEMKIDEILCGFKRVGKDWRPIVPGMISASK
jgi:hypothetical protein